MLASRWRTAQAPGQPEICFQEVLFKATGRVPLGASAWLHSGEESDWEFPGEWSWLEVVATSGVRPPPGGESGVMQALRPGAQAGCPGRVMGQPLWSYFLGVRAGGI